MDILCIETSTQVCSAAICREGVCIEERISRDGGNHAKLLPLFIKELLRSAEAHNKKIDAVALSEGPGSYTGLRIGTSTAKGICYGLDVPLIPVPTLEILCAAARTKGILQESTYALFPMIDARRMEVYTALHNKLQMSQVQAVVINNEESLLSLNESGIDSLDYYYFGDGAAKCQNVLTSSNWHFIPDIVPEAKYMGLLAEDLAANGKSVAGTDLAYYEPFYLKDFVAAQSHVKGLK